MWSFATRAPNRLVMPRSSSFISGGFLLYSPGWSEELFTEKTRGMAGEHRRAYSPYLPAHMSVCAQMSNGDKSGNATGRPAVADLPVERSRRCYCLGDEGDVTLIEPSMMPALILSSSPCRPASTFDSKSWNGAMPTPSFFSVPTYGVLSNFLLAAWVTTSEVAGFMPFMTEVRSRSFTVGSDWKTSASTPIIAIGLPESLIACAA